MYAQTKIQGHRGSKATHKENTIEAFAEANSAGVGCVELDVQMAADGKLVIVHDLLVEGRYVKDWDSKELGATYFSQFCERLVGWEMRANLEIKRNPRHPEYSWDRYESVKAIVEMVRYYGLQEKVYYSSFDLEALKIVRQLEPEATVGLAVTAKDFSLEALSGVEVDIISPDFEVLDEENVSILQKRGYIVAPWTVNGTRNWERMIEYGVDEIITDSPRELKSFLSALSLSFD
ncbi:MAG: Glycerophosphodiester phosphodiesterase [Chlamydiales bacterium]|nr:Glycerophosphodiester phosphodiesterase [Chlamydiales bacterium]MCH9635680.1 Glycerophosphodiester phosphodiesterase [Chlamydiales bacterium]MCH9704177.1 hypothetical protein [Chlamydiota bacterium]